MTKVPPLGEAVRGTRWGFLPPTTIEQLPPREGFLVFVHSLSLLSRNDSLWLKSSFSPFSRIDLKQSEIPIYRERASLRSKGACTHK